jgi:hypothetical protein
LERDASTGPVGGEAFGAQNVRYFSPRPSDQK